MSQKMTLNFVKRQKLIEERQKKAKEFFEKARLEHLKNEAERQKELQLKTKKPMKKVNDISKIWE